MVVVCGALLASGRPRFLAFPRFRHPADVVERAGLDALVGGGVIMVFTGVANVAQWYPWHFSFTASHSAVAWITRSVRSSPTSVPNGR